MNRRTKFNTDVIQKISYCRHIIHPDINEVIAAFYKQIIRLDYFDIFINPHLMINSKQWNEIIVNNVEVFKLCIMNIPNDHPNTITPANYYKLLLQVSKHNNCKYADPNTTRLQIILNINGYREFGIAANTCEDRDFRIGVNACACHNQKIRSDCAKYNLNFPYESAVMFLHIAHKYSMPIGIKKMRMYF